MRGRNVAVTFCAALALLLALTSGVAYASTPVVVPPNLQALEQKMLALQFTSERFSVEEAVAEKPHVRGPAGGFEHLFGHSSRLARAAAALKTFPLLTGVGEVSFAPVAASFSVSFLGLKFDARLLGTTLYLEQPFVSKLDGGRPWVEEQNQTLGKALGSDTSGPGGANIGEAGAGYKKLTEEIASARQIEQVGPATIDGQATTQFNVSLALSTLEQQSGSPKARKQQRTFRKLFDPLVRLELFIAEDGLPVRTRIVIGFHRGGQVITQEDVTAVNVPIAAVVAPPAAQTISKSDLEKLMAKSLKRLKHVVAVHRRSGAGKAKSK